MEKSQAVGTLPTNKDISLTVRGRLHSHCVRNSMLHARKENEVALQWALSRDENVR